MRHRPVRATSRERRERLPGDAIIPEVIGSLTHAITIDRPPRDVWPWLVQMGAGTRGGWYSYDRLDNGGRPSATRILPHLQNLHVGMVMPAVPGATDAFVVLEIEPERHLVLGALMPEGRPLVTWTFVLRPIDAGTRLIVRARGAGGYSFHGLPAWVSRLVIGAVNHVMERKQLLTLAERVEHPPDGPGTRRSRPRRAASTHRRGRAGTAVALLAGGLGLFAAGWVTYAAGAWLRFGRARRRREGATRHDAGTTTAMDTFMPVFDVVDRHERRVAAPAADTLAVACALPLLDLPLVRSIFRLRERLLGASGDAGGHPRGLLDHTRALGWVMLAECPGREIVMGAATRPWEADVTFRAIPPDAFATFAEPGFVKIVWALRADALSADATRFVVETRAVATDAQARAHFRRYWAWLSPGIRLIRPLVLRELARAVARRSGTARTPLTGPTNG